MVDLKQSGNRIPEAWSMDYMFPLMASISEKIKRELKNLSYSSHAIALSKGTNFAKKNPDFLLKRQPIIHLLFLY